MEDRGSNNRTTEVVAAVLLLGVALFAFGTVHPWAQSLVAVLGVALVTAIEWRHSKEPAPTVVAAAWVVASLMVALSWMWLAPIPNAWRAILQPAMAPALEASAKALGRDSLPIAISPGAAFVQIGLSALSLAVAISVSRLLRTRRRLLLLAGGMLGLGVLMSLVGLVHRVFGLEHIYGVSSVPARDARDAFWAPFVNPNHAGLFAAALLPLVGAFGRRRDPMQNAALLVAGVLCMVSVAMSGSRWAWVSAGVGILVAIGAGGSRFGGALVAGGSAVGMVVLAALGPQRVIDGLTRRLMPSAATPDWMGHRRELWSDTLALAKDAPWVGVGPGGFQDAWRRISSQAQFSEAVHSHQDILQLFAEWGWIFAGLWLISLTLPWLVAGREWVSLPEGRRRRTLGAVFGAGAVVCTGALMSFPFHIGVFVLLYALLMAMMVGAAIQRSRPAPRWLHTTARVARVVVLGSSFGAMAAPWCSMRSFSEDAAGNPASALGLRPLWMEGWLGWGIADAERGDASLAEARLDVASVAWPRSPWPNIARARLLGRQQRPREAESAWRAALTANLPDNDDALPWMRLALSDAPFPLERLVSITPERADRLRDAAVLAKERDDDILAEVFLARAWALDPKMGVAYGRHLVGVGLPAMAHDVILQLPADIRSSCAALRVETDAALAMGTPDLALVAARGAMTACGPVPAARRALLWARIAHGEVDSFSDVEAWLQAEPSAHDLRRLLLQALRKAGKHGQMAVHLSVLVDAGVATEQETLDLARVRQGLPPLSGTAGRGDPGTSAEIPSPEDPSVDSARAQ